MSQVISYNFNEAELRKKAAKEVESFMTAAILLGSEFLSCGGPVTRLEAQIATAGLLSGYETTVHATPSSISIFCHVPGLHESFSRGRRMQSFGVNLGRLRLIDKMLSGFAASELRPSQITHRLMQMKRQIKPPQAIFHFLSVFGIGTGAALLSGADFLQAGKCGLFTAFIRIMMIEVLGKIFTLSPMYVEFLSCFAAFLIAQAAKHFFAVPPQLLSLGTLVYIVPGLSLTTAISEIVDQNFLAGTIRLLKSLCTLMAMALAYFLAMDVGRLFCFNMQDVPFTSIPGLFARVLGSTIIILCSAFEFRAHRKSVPGILICGLSGAVCYIAIQSQENLVAPHFLAAFVIGLLSYLLSRRHNHPSQIYSVPSILILAPGMLAFSSFGYGAHEEFSIPSILRATLISLSIVFGLAASRLPFRMQQTAKQVYEN